MSESDYERGQNAMHKVLNFLFLLKLIGASLLVFISYHTIQVLTGFDLIYKIANYSENRLNVVWAFSAFRYFLYIFVIYKYCTYVLESLTSLSDGKKYVDEQFTAELERQIKQNIADNE